MTATGPTFTMVHAMVLMPKCSGCHGPAGGLMLAMKDAAYTALMANATGASCSTMKRVVPNMPEMSVLVMALKKNGCRMMAMQMPPAGPLPDTDIKMVEDWIKAGAMNN
jgi:hypothetical protein